jgi:hypothetical protein
MMQPDLFAARERGKVGSRRAGERADRASDGWTEKAANWIRVYADYSIHGESFLIEEASSHFGTPPPDPRAWGHATRLAVKRGWIKKVGYAPAASSNGSPKCLWAAA